jgi:hypothetical protein
MALTFRLFRDDDLPQVDRLWRESADWGPFPGDLYKSYFDRAPHGRPTIAVAEDAGTIVGQACMMPSPVTINGRQVPAFRPIAPIIAKDLRLSAFDIMQHPVAGMYRHAFSELKRRGSGLVFMIPDPHWVLLMKMVPGMLHGTFPLWSLPLPLSNAFELPAGYTCSRVDPDDPRLDLLWEKAAVCLNCAVVRNSTTLPVRTRPQGLDVLGLVRNGELVSVSCARQKGEGQWLLCDIVWADDEALRATLMAACNFAQAKTARGEAGPVYKAGILAVPAMQPALSSLGFAPDKYTFNLVVQILDDSIARADVEPSRWYISAND